MSENKNIFDLENIEDLPVECQVEIKRKSKNSALCWYILDLLKIKNCLSTVEIIAGLYREFKLIKTKAQVSSSVASLHYKLHQSEYELEYKDRKAGNYKLIKKTTSK